VRVWRDDHVVDPLPAKALAPLQLRPLRSERRSVGGRTEETLDFAAYAFSRAPLQIAAPVFVATPRGGGPVRNVTGVPLALQVEPALADADATSPAELPGDLVLPERSRAPLLAWAALAALAMAALWRWWWTRPRAARPVAVRAPEPPRSAAAQALARLAALRAHATGDLAFATELVQTLRDYARARWAVAATERTSEELTREVEARAGASASADLQRALAASDLVKFARAALAPAQAEAALAAGEEFVRATAEAAP
jgi:hypothetical protein